MMQIEQIGGFFPPAEIVRRAAAGLRRRRVSVSEAAARYRRLNNPGSYVGPWKNEMAPYLAEPMDACRSRSVEMVVVVGPSQFGKTEIPLSLVAHAAKVQPSDMLILQPTRELALDFADRRIEEKLLRPSPSIAAELGPARGDDLASRKTFRNGSIISVGYPTSGQISSRPIPIVVVDERDSMRDEIGDEGDPVTLARQRTKTFGSNACVYVSSSPKRIDYSGIIPLFDQGDRRLWFVPCPECEEYFAPGFGLDRRPLNVPPKDGGGFGGLHWPKGASAQQAADEARLVCPHCGSLIEERHKSAMNARGAWIAEGQEIAPDGTIEGVPVRGKIRSYWFAGVASNFSSWSQMAAAYVAAAEAFEARQDDKSLRAVVNTDYGFPYVSPIEDQRELTAEALEERAVGGLRFKTVPEWAEYLLAAVDVQGAYFDVAVWAYRRDNASALVDRFAIRQLDEGGNRVDVRPAENPEQWDVLLDEVLARRYPLAADPSKALRVAAMAIDTGGLDGVTVNAYEFFLRAVRGSKSRRAVAKKRIALVKGASTKTGRLVSVSQIDHVRRSRKVGVVDLHILNVHELKTIVSRRLKRESFGPSATVFPEDTPASVFAELLGERFIGGEWKRQGANETFDLAVYGAALQMIMQPGRWGASRPWFCSPVAIDGAGGSEGEPAADLEAVAGDPPSGRRARNARRPRRSGNFAKR